nr:MAG TPA: hypothetical protein [Inoviridae sp.]
MLPFHPSQIPPYYHLYRCLIWSSNTGAPKMLNKTSQSYSNIFDRSCKHSNLLMMCLRQALIPAADRRSNGL